MNTATKTRHEYSVEWRDGLEMTCRGRSHHEAAQHAAHRRFGRNSEAVRTTGDEEGSGYYQCYVPTSDGTATTSMGDPFHIAQDA